MAIKFNFNMCDNSPECSGLAVCPTGAIYWDENGVNALGDKGILCVDNSKCTSCGLCTGDEGCPIGAILFSKNEEDFGDESNVNTDQVKALFVERYGAEPIDESLCISDLDVLNEAKNDNITIIEEFTDLSIQCLLHSIPVSLIVERIQKHFNASDVSYYKHYIESENGEGFPRLLIYKCNKLIARVDGYFDDNQEEILLKKISI